MARARLDPEQRKSPPKARRRPGLTARLRTCLLAGIAVTAPNRNHDLPGRSFRQACRRPGARPASRRVRPQPVSSVRHPRARAAGASPCPAGGRLFRRQSRWPHSVSPGRTSHRPGPGGAERLRGSQADLRDGVCRLVAVVPGGRAGRVSASRPLGRGLHYGPRQGRGQVKERIDHDLVNIFLPTTPNPTSGLLLFLPREDLVPLDMSVEDGMKMVISAGIVTPPRAATDDAGEDSAATEP